MNKTITSIVLNKKKKVYTVFFGLDSLALSEDAFTDHYLYVGKEVPLKEINDLKKLSESENAYTYALSLAMKGTYSENQIREKIKDKFPADMNPSFIIERLKNTGFLDDMSLAKQYKEEKEAALYGEIRIKNDLIHKKLISEEIVDSLVFDSEEENAKKYASMIERRYDSYSLSEKKRKALNALLIRGYSKSVSLNAISSYKENKTLSKKKLQQEYVTLLRRYQLKYSGYECKRHIYAALLRKGYNSSEIKEIMEDSYDD